MKRVLLLLSAIIIFCFKVIAQTLTADAGPDTGRMDCYGPPAMIGGSPTATGGTPPYTYLWTPMGGFFSTWANPQVDFGLDSTTLFTVLVTDALGDTATDQVLVYVHHATIVTTADSVACLGDTDFFSGVSDGTPPFTYHWWFGGNNDTSILQNPSRTYYYTTTNPIELALTDAHSCTVVSIYVEVYDCSNFNAYTQDVLCYGLCNGSAQIYPVLSNKHYLWSNGDTTSAINNLCAGVYSCVVKDSVYTPMDTVTVTITEPVQMVLNFTHVDATCGLCDGSINTTLTGGSIPYNFIWSNAMSVQDPSGLCVGNYTITATDGNACSVSGSVSILNVTSMSISFSNVNVDCANQYGSATVLASGGTPGYTYQWSTGAIGSVITNLTPGIYCVWVTDVNSCVAYACDTITENTFTVQDSIVSASCAGINNGEIHLTPITGTPPYTYDWSDGINVNPRTNLSQGSKSVTITDGSGCITMKNYSVGTISNLYVTTTATNSTCVNNNGTGTASAYSGIPPYAYLWSTVPAQTTATATNLGVGNYSVTVSDASGCSMVRNASVNAAVSTISITTAVQYANCPSNNSGTAHISIVVGTPPFTFLWSTTPPQTTATATGLSTGYYNCLVTDSGSCKLVTVFVPYNNNIYLAANVTDENCTANGQISLTPYGGAPSYSYSWTGGQTTSTITNLQGNQFYSVSVTDNNNCSAFGYWFVDDHSQNLIQGKVFNDINGNCIQDIGEQPLRYIAVRANSRTVSADYYGNYSFWVPVGNYTVSIDNYNFPYWHVICPSSLFTYNISFPSNCDTATGDFAMQQYPNIQDLSVSLYTSIPRPGFSQYNSIYYRNKGSVALNAVVELRHDPMFSFTSSSPNYSSYSGNVMQWNVGLLQPGSDGHISYYTYLPVTYLGNPTLGMIAEDTAFIYPITGDTLPTDNISEQHRTVIGSYDPNMKECYPDNVTYVTDSILKYTIHFQNTGTDTAFTVVIRDTLSSSLDAATVMPGGASHDYKFTLAHDGILIWKFDGILLPDSNTDEPNSHGYVTFTVKQKPNLGFGTNISNTASIYFDFNEPVVTNTTQNVITNPNSVENLSVEEIKVFAFPNPFSNSTSIVVYGLKEKFDFTLFDATGRLLKTIPSIVTNQFEFKRDELSAGVYFYKLTSDGRQLANGKLIVE